MKEFNFTTGFIRGDKVWVTSRSSSFFKDEFVIFDFDHKNKNIIVSNGDEPPLAFKRDELKRVVEDARENK